MGIDKVLKPSVLCVIFLKTRILSLTDYKEKMLNLMPEFCNEGRVV